MGEEEKDIYAHFVWERRKRIRIYMHILCGRGGKGYICTFCVGEGEKDIYAHFVRERGKGYICTFCEGEGEKDIYAHFVRERGKRIYMHIL